MAKQILLIWQKLGTKQKAIGALSFFSLLLITLFFTFQKNNYIPLFPKALNGHLAGSLRATMKQEKIPFKEKKKGFFLVPEDKAALLRHSFEGEKNEGNKGLEILDSSTWIKGEKELQMLEWRALKGQLEKEIEKFENIKSAAVILDFVNFKQTKVSLEKPKVSCILSLLPGFVMTPSCLTAIISHLVSAVRGLEPQMIAISDTSGQMYKKHGQDGVDEKILLKEKSLHELKELLNRVVGDDHYVLNSNQLILDQNILTPSLQKELTKQCALNEISFTVETLPFLQRDEKEAKALPSIFYLSPLLALALIPLFLPKKKRIRSHDEIAKMIEKMDVNHLLNTIKREDPQTIALFLSYLDPNRAEKVISSLPHHVQEEVYRHLSELEKENV